MWEAVSTQELPPYEGTTGPLQVILMSWISERSSTQLRRGAQAKDGAERSEDDSDDISFTRLAPASTTARPTLSTFLFDPHSSSDRAVQSEEEAHHTSAKCTYALADLPAPLTHWTDAEVLVALTCDLRIVRVRMPRVSVEDGRIVAEGKGANAVWTLREPAEAPADDQTGTYAAASTATTNTPLLANASTSTASPITSRITSSKSSGCSAVESAPEDRWRAWDSKVDGQASDLKRGVFIEKLLQGHFVDADKLFSVSTRGGLNWSRKGHLSCATFGQLLCGEKWLR